MLAYHNDIEALTHPNECTCHECKAYWNTCSDDDSQEYDYYYDAADEPKLEQLEVDLNEPDS